MAATTALAHAFATADASLIRRALDDRYAEPVRADLIPNFRDVKRAALDAGALGCSISGSGPTIFAITTDNDARVAVAQCDGDFIADTVDGETENVEAGTDVANRRRREDRRHLRRLSRRRSCIVIATMSFSTPAAVTSAPAPGPVTRSGFVL